VNAEWLRHPLRFPRDHRFAAAHASDYVDGTLDAAGRARVERHARLCPRCRALLASLRGLLGALRELGAGGGPRAEADVARGVIARLRAGP
jgi:anti-sigma factor RsiW